MILSLDKQKEIIKDRINIETVNNTIALAFKGNITIFKDRLLKSKEHPLYVIVPNSAEKIETSEGTKWDYDMSEHDIYLIEWTDVEILVNFNNSSDKYPLPLHKLNKIFSTKKQIKLNIHNNNFSDWEKACVQLKVPKSGNKLIDDLIKESINGSKNGYTVPF
jgi:hypothetical protein